MKRAKQQEAGADLWKGCSTPVPRIKNLREEQSEYGGVIPHFCYVLLLGFDYD